MKAQKVKVTIEVETLSTDSVRSILIQAADQMHSEVLNGHLRMADGDQVTWATVFEKVEF